MEKLTEKQAKKTIIINYIVNLSIVGVEVIFILWFWYLVYYGATVNYEKAYVNPNKVLDEYDTIATYVSWFGFGVAGGSLLRYCKEKIEKVLDSLAMLKEKIKTITDNEK